MKILTITKQLSEMKRTTHTRINMVLVTLHGYLKPNKFLYAYQYWYLFPLHTTIIISECMLILLTLTHIWHI